MKMETTVAIGRCSPEVVSVLADIKAATAYETASDHQLNRAARCLPTLQPHRGTWECSNTVSLATPHR